MKETEEYKTKVKPIGKNNPKKKNKKKNRRQHKSTIQEKVLLSMIKAKQQLKKTKTIRNII